MVDDLDDGGDSVDERTVGEEGDAALLDLSPAACGYLCVAHCVGVGWLSLGIVVDAVFRELMALAEFQQRLWSGLADRSSGASSVLASKNFPLFFSSAT